MIKRIVNASELDDIYFYLEGCVETLDYINAGIANETGSELYSLAFISHSIQQLGSRLAKLLDEAEEVEVGEKNV